jgi:hypothetical protein
MKGGVSSSFFDSRRVDGHILGLEEMEWSAEMLSRDRGREGESRLPGRRRAEIAVAGWLLALHKHLGLHAVVVHTRAAPWAGPGPPPRDMTVFPHLHLFKSIISRVMRMCMPWYSITFLRIIPKPHSASERILRCSAFSSAENE